MSILDMKQQICNNKFYLMDTYESHVIYVDKLYGVISVKESLYHNKIIYLGLTAVNLSCTAEEVELYDLRKYDIELASFIELMNKESRKL